MLYWKPNTKELIYNRKEKVQLNIEFSLIYLFLHSFLYLIIISSHRILIHSYLSCNETLICDRWVLPHIGCNQLFLLADAVRDGAQVAALPLCLIAWISAFISAISPGSRASHSSLVLAYTFRECFLPSGHTGE